MKCCESFDHPNMPHMWVCAVCKPKTLNSNARASCKACGHRRCDSPETLSVPFQEENGIRVVKLDLTKERPKENLN